MRKLVIHEKTGFQSLMPFTIKDERHLTFYNSDFVEKISNNQPMKFNLPKGVYFYDGTFQKLQKPVFFQEITLPEKERNFSKQKFKIRFGKNPNKCTVNHLSGVITFDNAFRKAPKYVIFYIFFHEIGHRYYKTESYADLYAIKKMLEVGFNPSQIGRAPIVSLRRESFERKNLTVKTLNNLKNG